MNILSSSSESSADFLLLAFLTGAFFTGTFFGAGEAFGFAFGDSRGTKALDLIKLAKPVAGTGVDGSEGCELSAFKRQWYLHLHFLWCLQSSASWQRKSWKGWSG